MWWFWTGRSICADMMGAAIVSSCRAYFSFIKEAMYTLRPALRLAGDNWHALVNETSTGPTGRCARCTAASIGLGSVPGHGCCPLALRPSLRNLASPARDALSGLRCRMWCGTRAPAMINRTPSIRAPRWEAGPPRSATSHAVSLAAPTVARSFSAASPWFGYYER
jgi:hypothetical protein